MRSKKNALAARFTADFSFLLRSMPPRSALSARVGRAGLPSAVRSARVPARSSGAGVVSLCGVRVWHCAVRSHFHLLIASSSTHTAPHRDSDRPHGVGLGAQLSSPPSSRAALCVGAGALCAAGRRVALAVSRVAAHSLRDPTRAYGIVRETTLRESDLQRCRINPRVAARRRPSCGRRRRSGGLAAPGLGRRLARRGRRRGRAARGGGSLARPRGSSRRAQR